jgi:hypothetical protein
MNNNQPSDIKVIPPSDQPSKLFNDNQNFN